MIETNDLTKKYGELFALERLTIKLEAGDVYGFIGPNGSGKTTTMRILATLLNPTWGEATVCGYSIYNNAKEIREGQMKVLKPAVAAGKIKIVGDGWAENWSAAEAEKQTEAALKKTGNKLAAIVASNDQLAGGAIKALTAAKLDGKVLVSGQDAELDACKRLVAGTQAMTVYKPLSSLARMAVNNAVHLAKGEAIDAASTVNNGKKDVPTRALDPIAVDKNNLDGVLINDGYHTRDEVYGKK